MPHTAVDTRDERRKNAIYSQGGVKVPTGGIPACPESPRALPMGGGQQIRCETGADGNSPDEREWTVFLHNVIPAGGLDRIPVCGHVACAGTFPVCRPDA